MFRIILIATFILFGIFTAFALWNEGITSVPASIMHSYNSIQMYVDLVIAAMLINVWIWHDAQAHGRNPWGWIIATLIVGSFSPLLYLITRNSSKISE
jgi:RsiW-degrading membrane proteinase PrsW (M82 family)